MALTQKNPGGERTRGPNLVILMERSSGIQMEEALARADEAGLVMASNKRLSKALVGSNEWRNTREAFACWTGTMTGYDKPDQKLGKTIEYTNPETGVRCVFPVPQGQQGKKNVILVAEHPNFCFVKDGNDMIVQATEVGVVEGFPALKGGWFRGDHKYDIPCGDKVDGGKKDARYLCRIEKRVGLIARGCSGYDDVNLRRFVGLDVASGSFWVAIEAAAANAASGAPLRIRETNGGLVVEGTPEQIAAATRLLKQMKAK